MICSCIVHEVPIYCDILRHVGAQGCIFPQSFVSESALGPGQARGPKGATAATGDEDGVLTNNCLSGEGFPKSENEEEFPNIST